ncbi:MAG: 2-hydroxyacyl-CoA dehydratase [Ruminococcaceae bacterium]|nr:2-hydroxyacyl-CoA dehydratase [Oscillospiraceae bacterium]
MADEKKNYETRSIKRLEATKAASAYQKEWFQSLRPRVEAGEPFALVGADAPMEILRAMDIPFVVYQWWTAICAAKQMNTQMYGYIRDAGYRDDICSYCSTAYACALDPHPEEGPWGGLPNPSILITQSECAVMGKIENLMAEAFGAEQYTMQRYYEPVITEKWWEKTIEHWDELANERRRDFFERELRDLIAFLEQKTGRMFDMNKLREIMDYVNEQDYWYRKTRDLIAETVPCPVTISDTVNAVMQAQWQRGTKWATDHAKSLYEEIKYRADNNMPAVPNERIRLMWIGRGLWFNLGFYNYFEEKYGAAFIWSMYLGLAADAYGRENYESDPLKALGTRFSMITDFLHTPPFNSEWFLKEARHNQVDGVVLLTSENCMNNGDFYYNMVKTLEDNGFPVCLLRADPADAKKWNQETMTAAVEDLIVNRIEPKLKDKK